MIKKILLSLSFASLLVFSYSAAVIAASDTPSIQNGLCAGANLDVNQINNCNPNDPQAINKISDILHLIINMLSLLVGVVSVVMIIIGGLKYIVSSGDSSNVSSAKNTIIYALVGLVIVALAQFMVRFVLAKVANT